MASYGEGTALVTATVGLYPCQHGIGFALPMQVGGEITKLQHSAPSASSLPPNQLFDPFLTGKPLPPDT